MMVPELMFRGPMMEVGLLLVHNLLLRMVCW